MQCQYCEIGAAFICECFCKICKNHLSIHIETCSTPTTRNIVDNDRLIYIDPKNDEKYFKQAFSTANLNKSKRKYKNQLTFENTKEAMKWLENDHGLILECHASIVRSVAISYDNKYIVSGGGDKIVRVWSLQRKLQEALLEGHASQVSSVAITHNNKYIVSGGYDRLVIIWNLQEKAKKLHC